MPEPHTPHRVGCDTCLESFLLLGPFMRFVHIIAAVIFLLSPNILSARGQAPTVREVAPVPHALAVPATTEIVVTFDGSVDRAAFEQHGFGVFGRWSGVVTGTFQWDPDHTHLRFVPSKPFMAGEHVTVSLNRMTVAEGGEPLATGYAWGFWVATGPGSLDVVQTGRLPVRRSGEGWVQAYGAYAGDLDGDGYSDLAIPNERANDVRIFINDGRGGYGDFTILDIPNGAVPSPNEGADFNGDGIVDFAVGNAGNDLVSVFLGRGAGQFDHAGNYSADRGVRGVCILDVDGDGDPDIATANNRGRGRGNVSVLVNDGAGNFARTANYEDGARNEKTCATADVNNDGIMDVVVGAYRSKEIVVYRGDGDGGLVFDTKVPAGGSPWMIVAGDVNGDGFVDVLAANRDEDNLGVILNDGTGGWRPAVTYRAGSEPLAVDAGDIDGDGDLDVVTSNVAGANFTLFENFGDGTFGNPRTLKASSAGSCAILHDRDNDGDLDITGVDEIDDLIFLYENVGR